MKKYPVQQAIPEKINAQENAFFKANATWKISYDGATIQAVEVKGLYDIQKLLMQPGQLFHCAELMGSTLEDSGEKLIDEKARKQYQRKILELQGKLEEAEQFSNFEQIEKLHEEYDQLVEHLSSCLNLNRKIRETGGTIDKAKNQKFIHMKKIMLMLTVWTCLMNSACTTDHLNNPEVGSLPNNVIIEWNEIAYRAFRHLLNNSKKSQHRW